MLVDSELRATVQPGDAGSLPQQCVLLCCGLVALCCLCGFVASQVRAHSLPVHRCSTPFDCLMALHHHFGPGCRSF